MPSTILPTAHADTCRSKGELTDRDGQWWRSNLVSAISAGVIGLTLSLCAWVVIAHREDRFAEQEFNARANSHALSLQRGIDEYIGEVAAIRSLFQSSERGVTRREFTAFSEYFLRNHPAILAVSWIPRIMRNQREAHEQAAVSEGLLNYHIKAPTADRIMAAAPEANEYFPVFYSSNEPLDSAIYGLNLNDGGLRQQTLNRARDEDRLATSSNFLLQTGDGNRDGFFVVLPVFVSGLPHDTVEDRRRNLLGFVQGVFQTGLMFETILRTTTTPGGLDLYVFAPESGDEAPPLYFHASRVRKVETGPLPKAALTRGLRRSYELRVGDSRWTLIAAPIPGGPGTTGYLTAAMVLIGGICVTMVVSAYFWASSQHGRRLNVANVQLDALNDELLAQNVRFETALNNMSQGLIMFDSAEQLVVCNDLYIDMYGLSRDVVKPGCSLIELLRHRVETGGYLLRPPEDYRAEVLAAIAAGKVTSFIVETAAGREISVTNSPMATGGWVATHEDITERRRAEAKIAYMAHHDALTELPNRVYFHEQLQQVLVRSARGEQLAVFCLDLDHFKDVNDALGHPVGDLLLKAAAERLRQCIRDTDMVARLGGDEFVIMQVDARQPTDATSLASRLIEAISAPFQLGSHQVVVGVSIGIALAPDDGRDPNQLLRNADMALYRAKADGRGLYRFFEPAMDARMQARRKLEIDLRKAIADGEFELYYQPLVDVRSDCVTGFEALIRWHHPERGMIPPLDFIPVAEETGLIVPLGDWVLRQACAEAATWPSDVKIAVNLSPIQFKNKSLLPSIISALASSGLSPTRLELEITESVLLQDSDTTLTTLHQLRDLGVRISMDDFGTGYSSLSYLRKFPFDKIKIDQSFIRDMSLHGDSLAIVRAVVAMGTSLCIGTTAEGVETAEQLKQLKLEGCTEVQGYLFSRPRPAAEVRGMLAAINPKLKAIA
jgi:diguanylate cyclase (GGDEF)-like protein